MEYGLQVKYCSFFWQNLYADTVLTLLLRTDLHLVRCPVCSLKTCEGTMQTLDARHYELFLHDEWKCGEWKYEQLASHEAPFHCPQAAGGLFDAGTIGRQELKARSHAVAASTNLQPNEGLKVRCEVLKGTGGRISGIRVSQQLL
ncbi:unnamed protein product [Closterium sp. NIES-53]